MFAKLTPNEVFTPRAPRVNSEMYIHRQGLEAQLKEALKGHKHFIIHGESGNGKTWLYKKVFLDTKTNHTIVNLATAANYKSIEDALQEKWNLLEPQRKISEAQEKQGGVKLGVNVTGKKKSDFRFNNVRPFMGILQNIKGVAKKHSIVVFDNFERIADKPELVEELANYLILLDDDDYAKYFARICIVGVPGDLKEYFSNLPYAETISTRLTEIDEVERMTFLEAEELLRRGFSKLRLSHKSSESDISHLQKIIFVSDRTAVELHQLGFKIAERAVRNEGIIEFLDIDDAITEWISEKYSKICADIEARMSPAGIENGRRNQILFSLGLIDTEEFDKSTLKKIIRKEFPKNCEWIDQMFEEKFAPFLEGFDPMIKRGTQIESYRISKAAYRMAIRSMLKRTGGSSVSKVMRKI